jgi:hypothetical protein
MKTKYETIDDRENLLKNILSVNSIFSDAFINDGYYKNISFDAGLGEIKEAFSRLK